MDRRTAQRFMQAAVKFRLSLTAAQSVRFDHLSRGKLYELLVLDDDQIAELADGGSVAGLHLDAIHTMSTTELRAKVREAEAKLEAKDRVLDKRAEQIEQLEAEVDRLTHARPPEQVLIAQEREAELIAMLQEAMLGVLGAVTQWEAAIAACLSEPSTARTTLATEATRFLFQRLAQVSEEHNLPVDFAAVAAPPDWLSQVAGAQA